MISTAPSGQRSIAKIKFIVKTESEAKARNSKPREMENDATPVREAQLPEGRHEADKVAKKLINND